MITISSRTLFALNNGVIPVAFVRHFFPIYMLDVGVWVCVVFDQKQVTRTLHVSDRY